MIVKKPIILDANILIRACLGEKVPILLDKLSSQVIFFTPDICVVEAKKYIPNLLKKRSITIPPRRNLDEILLVMNILSEQQYCSFEV